jgi:hypothetical protein
MAVTWNRVVLASFRDSVPTENEATQTTDYAHNGQITPKNGLSRAFCHLSAVFPEQVDGNHDRE